VSTSTANTSSAASAASRSQLLESELHLYDGVHECDIETDPLLWWQRNAATFPLLATFVQK